MRRRAVRGLGVVEPYRLRRGPASTAVDPFDGLGTLLDG